MNCPKCNHPVSLHDNCGCWYDNSCACILTEKEAMLAAQRHSAAVELLSLKRARWMMYHAKVFVEFAAVMQTIMFLRSMIRELGIQRQRQRTKK